LQYPVLESSVFNLKSLFKRSRHTQAVAAAQQRHESDSDDGADHHHRLQNRNIFGRLFGPWRPAPHRLYGRPGRADTLEDGGNGGYNGDDGDGGGDDNDNGDGDGDGVFAPRRSLSAKAALEPRLRCTEVDEHGNFTAVDGEFKKTELIAKVGS
jgi:hypothetical protein